MRRVRKTLRNLILCVLLWTVSCAAMGFPTCTVRGMLGRAERQYLLSGLEPVLVERDSVPSGSGLFNLYHRTFLLARTGDSYVAAEFERHLLEMRTDFYQSLRIRQGAICAAWNGTLYVAGDFMDAASASAGVTAERTTQQVDTDSGEFQTAYGERETFTYEGEKVSGEVFAFRYEEKENLTSTWTGLASAAHNWYRIYAKGDAGGGHVVLHADLPVAVTLYDRDGAVLETLELEIDNYELYGIW